MGSGGTGSDIDASAGGSTGSGGSTGPGGSTGGSGVTGVGGSGGSTGGTQPTADARPDAPGTAGASGMAGNGGAGGGGFDAREARVDARPDASVDAPVEVGCPNPTQCALKAALVHRYMFNGAATSTTVTDSVGNANGTVVGTTLSGAGTVVFAGDATAVNDQYVNLPNGIIRQLTNATVEVWFSWAGGNAWQRIFDFGDSNGGAEGTQGAAVTTFYLTPLGGGPAFSFAALKNGVNQTGPMETRAVSATSVVSGPLTQIAVVVDDTNNQLNLYRNGALDASAVLTDPLSVLNDINNWIGRSQYSGDPHLGATIYDFRIYNVALPAASVQASFTGGTDPAFLN
jgi:hypothetical protein